jgi:transposase
METNKNLEFLLSFILPESILDWFEFVNVTEEPIEPKKDGLFKSRLHIYLDERDNRANEHLYLNPNGFTEPTEVADFPIRDHKVMLHIRRRRWKDEAGHNVILNIYPITAEGTRYSEEFAAFLKGSVGYDPGDFEALGSILSD